MALELTAPMAASRVHPARMAATVWAEHPRRAKLTVRKHYKAIALRGGLTVVWAADWKGVGRPLGGVLGLLAEARGYVQQTESGPAEGYLAAVLFSHGKPVAEIVWAHPDNALAGWYIVEFAS